MLLPPPLCPVLLDRSLFSNGREFPPGFAEWQTGNLSPAPGGAEA